MLEPEIAKLIQEGHDPFHLPGLHYTRETSQSVAINKVAGGAIIMAGSGMCTGGRVRHHLKHNLSRRESGVVFVGYAAIGTLARTIIDGAKEVNILGERSRCGLGSSPSTASPLMLIRPSCWPGKSKPARNVPSLFAAMKTRCEVLQRFSMILKLRCPSQNQALEL